jgi:hypothetical protein
MTIRANSAIDDQVILGELDMLMRETYTLWDEIWVGFSWRNYTYNHVTRVRNLARTIGEREGAEMRPLEFAALMHDITKSYDGEIMMRDGKRVVDENGFWLNETLPPARQNKVTRLYDQLNLHNQVHHVSGGQITRALLEEYGGFDTAFIARVEEIIHSHLKVGEYSSVAGRSLYDADTIDANIGLPALYRNFQIVSHRQEQEFEKRGEDFDVYLRDNLREFLVPYIRERLPTWNNGKRDDFISKLTTESAKDIARGRIERLAAELDAMSEELEDFDRAIEKGRLAVVKRLLVNHQNPSLSAELEFLSNEWIPVEDETAGARALVTAFELECDGLA